MAKEPILNPKHQPKWKHEDVQIINITVAQVPTPMGTPGVMVVGLGNDSEIYTWESSRREWMES